jgi:3-isopropylmalate dehydrogenase
MTKDYKISVLPGDGIGPEVTAEAVKVLKATGLDFEFWVNSVGGNAYLKTGESFSKEAREACEKADAVLFGAVGHDYAPYDIPRKVLDYLRMGKDTYVNLRPLKLYPKIDSPLKLPGGRGVDIVIIRENTEGESVKQSSAVGDRVSSDTRIITRFGSQRLIKYAFEYARAHKRSKLTCVDMSKLLAGDELFREVFDEVSEWYPEVEKDYRAVDVAALLLVSKTASFDMIVTSNLYGDILSGLLCALIGGVGMAPSACIGDRFAYFEPVHGTAWDIAGQEVANPIAEILSAKLMLEWLRENEAAEKVERAVMAVLEEGKIRTPDIGGASKTSQVGDAVARKVEELSKK